MPQVLRVCQHGKGKGEGYPQFYPTSLCPSVKVISFPILVGQEQDPFFHGLYIYPAENEHIPYQGTFEHDFPFYQVGCVGSLEGIYIYM